MIEIILLTPELLEKYGFILSDYRDSKTSDPGNNLKYSKKIGDSHQYIGIINKGDWFIGGHYDDPFYGFYLPYKIQYLHQLQNLYFALTNEKL